MANIKVELNHEIIDGQPITFVAPCDCTAVTGLKVYYPGGSKVFTFKDAHGNALTGVGNLFSQGAYVKAILDVINGNAYLQNADTNKYLETALAGKAPKDNGIQLYTHSSGNLTGTGTNGRFKATSSGTISSIKVNGTTYSVKQGGESSVELISGCWYTFILDGKTVNFNAGGGGTKLFAAIGVTYPAGSTVTCTNGTKTLTAKNTSGKWVFAIPAAGTWTVKAVSGSNSKSQSVSITEEGQFEAIDWTQFVLIAQNTAALATGYTQSGGTLVQDNTYGNYYKGNLLINPKINVTPYKKLRIKCCAIGNAAANPYSINFGLYTSAPSLTNYTPAAGVSIADTTTAWGVDKAKEFEVNIENLTGEYYFGSYGYNWNCGLLYAIFE